MKIKLDENLPRRLVGALALLGHEVDNVWMEGLTGEPDERVWEVAQAEERFFITLDQDFSDIRQFPPGEHHGIMLIRIEPKGRDALLDQVTDAFAAADDVETWRGCFLVLSERTLRIKRPPE